MTQSIKQFSKLFTGLLICSFGIIFSVYSMLEQWDVAKNTYHEGLVYKSALHSEEEQLRATVKFSRKVIENKTEKHKKAQS